MKWHEFFVLFLVIFLAGLAALIVWTLIVKNQIASTVGNNSGVGTILSLLGSK